MRASPVALEGWRERVAVPVGFCVLTLAFTYPLLWRLGSAVPHTLGDPLLNAWILTWGADRLRDGLRGFWTPPIFYPHLNTLAFTENLLGIAIQVAPLRWAGAGPLVIYNVAFLLSFVVAGCGMYLLARELTGRRDAAAIAGLAYAFIPYRSAQLSHLQVLTAGWLPLALWALDRFLVTGGLRMLALATAAALLQVFSNSYSLFYSLVVAAPLVAWRLGHTTLTRRAAIALGVASVVVILLLLPLGRVYRGTLLRIGDNRAEVLALSADLGTYLQVDDRLWMAPWLPGVSQPEGNLFPGVTVLLLACCAFLLAPAPVPKRTASSTAFSIRIPPWVWLIVLIASVVVSLGPQLRSWGRPLGRNLPYEWLALAVPGFELIRVPARFGMGAMLAVAALAGVGMARLLVRVPATIGVVLTAGCSLAILAEGYGGPMPLPGVGIWTRPHEQAAYRWLRDRPPGPALELPVSSLAPSDHSLEYQYAVLTHGHPIVNGVGRGDTPLEGFLGGSASPFSDPTSLQAAVSMLAGLKIRYVVLHTPWVQAEVRDRLLDALRARSESEQRFEDISIFTLPLAPHGVRDRARDLRRIPPESLRLTAAREPGRLPFALDGRPQTRWLSGRPQDGTEWIRIDFDRPRDVRLLQTVMTRRSLGDYPRGLRVESIRGPGDVRVEHDGPVLERLGEGFLGQPDEPVVDIDVLAGASTGLVLRQTGADPTWYWSIDELRVWERPPAEVAFPTGAKPR
jgi:hypothetical protein